MPPCTPVVVCRFAPTPARCRPFTNAFLLNDDMSLTDCASFVIMKRRSIDEALTDDHHFEQNGVKALLKAQP